jgi:hypothetical protein
MRMNKPLEHRIITVTKLEEALLKINKKTLNR